MTKKVLIYTDSRGQHTPRGLPIHKVFAERLAEHPDIEADVVLCPMKWTTTLDFLDFLEGKDLSQWDHIILYTGIVDWSPRPQPSAINDLYDNKNPSNLDNDGLNTRDYSKKVVNNKAALFNAVFGEDAIRRYLNTDLGVEYEGQPTVNMYGLDMARRDLLPKLKAIPNLIFINSNRFVPGWEGDFTRGRPANIGITEQYSELFRDELGPDRLIDLLEWDREQIQTFTCDNLHLTKAGSDWIYDRLIERLFQPSYRYESADGAAPISPFGNAMTIPNVLTPQDRQEIRARCGVEGPVATLIIGVKVDSESQYRTPNLEFLLRWINHFYGDLFDVLIVEQGVEARLDPNLWSEMPSVRYEFLYNDSDYNRGWGYNAAVRHFTTLDVVALLDTDVLLGGNFVDEIIRCHGDFDVISPYKNVYFTTSGGADLVRNDLSFRRLSDESRVRKPTTLTGGVVIIKRSVFQRFFGFEQYIGYGGEDRSFDVTLLSQLPPSRIRTADRIYVHMFHESASVDHAILQQILKDVAERYGCVLSPGLGPADSIHVNCRHATAEQTQRLAFARAPGYGELDLYSSQRRLKINGVPSDSPGAAPPAYLREYPAKELYDGGLPDVDRIASLHDAYAGKRCVIIGNGPSLNKHDLSLLESEYTFAVNSFFYKSDETGFIPSFFTVEDNAVMKDNSIVKFQPKICKFFPTIYRKFHPERLDTIFFEMNRGFYEKTGTNFCVPRFSTDMTEVLYCGQSVTYINLQIAYFLGFCEVYLIGMDFDYVIPKEHKRNGDLILSTTDDPNHFHKGYFGPGKTWKDPKLDRVGMNYRQAKLSYEAAGRKIFNATIGGKLEIFERRAYEDVFGSELERAAGVENV